MSVLYNDLLRKYSTSEIAAAVDDSPAVDVADTSYKRLDSLDVDEVELALPLVVLNVQSCMNCLDLTTADCREDNLVATIDPDCSGSSGAGPRRN